jgi:hypothetical protein
MDTGCSLAHEVLNQRNSIHIYVHNIIFVGSTPSGVAVQQLVTLPAPGMLEHENGGPQVLQMQSNAMRKTCLNLCEFLNV